ncbi:hypothetical protein B7486_68540, partial [cyanobacterium TDX16]
MTETTMPRGCDTQDGGVHGRRPPSTSLSPPFRTVLPWPSRSPSTHLRSALPRSRPPRRTSCASSSGRPGWCSSSRRTCATSCGPSWRRAWPRPPRRCRTARSCSCPRARSPGCSGA